MAHSTLSNKVNHFISHHILPVVALVHRSSGCQGVKQLFLQLGWLSYLVVFNIKSDVKRARPVSYFWVDMSHLVNQKNVTPLTVLSNNSSMYCITFLVMITCDVTCMMCYNNNTRESNLIKVLFTCNILANNFLLSAFSR